MFPTGAGIPAGATTEATVTPFIWKCASSWNISNSMTRAVLIAGGIVTVSPAELVITPVSAAEDVSTPALMMTATNCALAFQQNHAIMDGCCILDPVAVYIRTNAHFHYCIGLWNVRCFDGEVNV